jgi:glycosyltransferase involved in cell wall biosynthesis
VYILPNGIKNEFSDKELEEIIRKKTKQNHLNFLFLSNMAPSKGPLDVLRFCKELKKKNIKFKCIFSGRSSDAKFIKVLNREISKLNLLEECKYLGGYDPSKRNKLLGEADFLIFPTKYPMECYPLVILEAFMAGVPVLSYNTGAIKEMISEEYLGVTSNKRTPKDLYNLFIKKRKKFNRKKIRRHFKNNFVLKIATEKLNKIILKEL